MLSSPCEGLGCADFLFCLLCFHYGAIDLYLRVGKRKKIFKLRVCFRCSWSNGVEIFLGIMEDLGSEGTANS